MDTENSVQSFASPPNRRGVDREKVITNVVSSKRKVPLIGLPLRCNVKIGAVGCSEAQSGCEVGSAVGDKVVAVGSAVGRVVMGSFVGSVGIAVGIGVGIPVGLKVMGSRVGQRVGKGVGLGAWVGSSVGAGVGAKEGRLEVGDVGALVKCTHGTDAIFSSKCSMVPAQVT